MLLNGYARGSKVALNDEEEREERDAQDEQLADEVGRLHSGCSRAFALRFAKPARRARHVSREAARGTAGDIVRRVILENGLIRTLEPALPVARALAIAGERIVGGVGTHETALASPEVVDLRGRCVVPGFSDAHVHFPTWALAKTQIDLDGCGSIDEALGRVRSAPA